MRKHFFQRTLITLAFAVLLSSLAACTRPDKGTVIPTAQRQQVFQLQGRIQQGPSAGLNLSGELRTTIDSAARLQGLLVPETGSAITVTGQIDGQAIHLSFDRGNNNVVLGVGTLQHSIDNPQGTAGGMLTGPQPGDSGDWFARWTTITIPVTPALATPVSTLPSNDGLSLPTLLLYLLAGLIAVLILFSIVMVRANANSRDSDFLYSIYERIVKVTMRVMPPSSRTTSQKSDSLSELIDTAAKYGDLDKPRSAKRGKKSKPSFVKASAQMMEPERWPDEPTLPLLQFATTYAHGDDHYDLSFPIETPRGEFLGECGAGISATATRRKSKSEAASEVPVWLESLATKSDVSKHKPVTALEVWLFDKNDINTVTKVLRSAHGFYEPEARSSRNPVNDVLVIEPDQTVVLETKTLRLRAKVLAVEYMGDLTYSSDVFKQVSLKLAAWSR